MNKKYKIAVITTSAPITSLSESEIKSAYNYLEGEGFEIFEHPLCRKITDYTSGTAQERAEALHDVIKDKSVDIVMAFWGGDNTNQMLDLINYDLIKLNQKIIVGYSDTSSLLNAINKKTGIVTYLGPAIITFCKPNIFNESLNYFKKIALNKEENLLIIPPTSYAADAYYKRNDHRRIILENDGNKVFRSGTTLNKKIVAINLTILQSLFGTEYEPTFEDKVLFCEIDESVNTETLDRMFVQLRQNRVLSKISGLVFSKVTDESEVSNSQLLKIFNENINSNIPVIYNFDCGHTDPIITIPVGGRCSIKADNSLAEIIIN